MATIKARQIAARIDAFCGRLNGGLAAVAVVLALAVLATASVRAERRLAIDPGAMEATAAADFGDPLDGK